ncbi:MAG: hypothetical protein ACK5N8_03260 [Alphaproteobacteria bacterium]
MKKIYFGHSSDIDYNLLYNLLLESTLYQSNNIFLPHLNGQNVNTIELIKKCDLFIAEVSKPSTGLGIELGIAYEYKIPIACLFKTGNKPSSSLKYISTKFIEYSDEISFLKSVEELLF